MSVKRYFYSRQGDNFTSIDNESQSSSEAEAEFPEISSSSVSSSFSIPWANDAIKQNQLDWERCQRMFYGEEDLPKDQELRNEILEWQQKFPNILKEKMQTNALQDSSLNFDSISSATLNSDEDENDYSTPTNNRKNKGFYVFSSKKHQRLKGSDKTLESMTKSTTNGHENLINMLDRDLRISSVPMNIRNLSKDNKMFTESRLYPTISRRPLNNPNFNEFNRNISQSQFLPQTGGKKFNSETKMPPILHNKVIDRKRHFQGLSANPSFIQLTPIQVQSAATTNRFRREQRGVSTTNKNSIILPAINVRNPETPLSTNSSENSHQDSKILSGFKRNQLIKTSEISLLGRSASAAHNRVECAFYLPYSANKFKVFK